jgi:hypothetical protein
MKLNREKICIALVMIVLILVFGGAAYASEEADSDVAENTISEEMQTDDEEMTEPEPTVVNTVTVIGTVHDDYVLVSKQGIAYGIAETEVGDVMGQYVGEEVIVKGIISVEEDQKYISVISFEFVEN